MASSTTENASRHYHHEHNRQPQVPQRYGSTGSGNGNSQTQASYTLYPDPPLSHRSNQQQDQYMPQQRQQQQHHQQQQQQQQQYQQRPPHQQQQQQQQRSIGELTPQNSFSSITSQNDNNASHSPPVSRGGSGSSGVTKAKQSQLSYLRSAPVSTSSNPYGVGAPPSPISPSSPLTPSSADIITSQMNLTRLDEPIQDRVTLENYDPAKYQQARKKSISAVQQQQSPYQQRHQQLQDDEAVFGGPTAARIKQSSSSGSSRSVGSQSRELKQSSSSASAHSVGSQGSRELKQSSSSASAHSVNSISREDRSPLRQLPSTGSSYSSSSRELKQSGSSASATSVSSSRSQQLHPSHSNGSNASSSSSSAKRQYQQSQQQQHNNLNNNNLSNLSMSPSSPSPLSYLQINDDDEKDRGEQDSEKLREQALQYQQKLQQKPPSVHDDDDSGDDSDSSSMLSYRRSISRLSMSYKRTQNGGAPNISLFSPGQRSALMNNSGGSGGYSSGLTESQKMIQEQREERLRLQLQHQQPQPQHGYGGLNDQRSPTIARNGSGGYPQRDLQIPDRSTSADGYNGNGRSRQQQGLTAGPGGRSNPSSPSISHRQLNGSAQQQHQQQHQHQQNSQHNQQRSMPDRLNLPQSDNQNDNISMAPRSRSPGPMGGGAPARSPGSPLPGSSAGSGGGGGGVYRQNGYPGGFNASSTSLAQPPSRVPTPGPGPGGLGMNPHPAHHLAAGGYVRPEEAVGPSNPMPEKAEDYVRQGIEYHEIGDIGKATFFFRTAAELGDPVGMLMYGLSVRHGWGCSSNRQLAFQYLQKSAEHAVGDLKSRDSFASTAAKGELVLAIYELGICFRHGWGVEKNKKTAAYYFEIAANLGDPDAQNDLAWCYYHGVGVKKDMYKAAKYYRLAAAQGLETVGNSWIWKDKYGGKPASPTTDKPTL
ncbi:hypothetical protein BGZ46_002456 [Entomortierella lignicola]|nr:hypothetical protein BGZ46_002456 [Entomortierella lignicola]